jgi:TetR/AcrR family transcriptional regulator
MSESGSSRRGRVHNAEEARETILSAAEKVFTKHGFDGARIDAIAAESGYNKSLIFQYFGDKLGLYVEVARRADQEMSVLQARLLAPFFEDETVASDAGKFKALLETLIGGLFDYLVMHPHLVRILLWEQAEGWQTYMKILSQFNTEDMDQFEALFRTARKAGLLRSDYSPMVQLTSALQLCFSYLAWTPIYQILLPDQDHSSAAALPRVREYLINFIVAGMMVDPGT